MVYIAASQTPLTLMAPPQSFSVLFLLMLRSFLNTQSDVWTWHIQATAGLGLHTLVFLSGALFFFFYRGPDSLKWRQRRCNSYSALWKDRASNPPWSCPQHWHRQCSLCMTAKLSLTPPAAIRLPCIHNLPAPRWLLMQSLVVIIREMTPSSCLSQHLSLLAKAVPTRQHSL